MPRWLLLTYKIPREPTAGRVYVWRKLKQLGAITLQDAVWVLPATPRTQEQFQWLASEIVELGGDATHWAADVLSDRQDRPLIEQFESAVDEVYREILAALKRKARNLAALSKRYQETQARDYFHSALGHKVREKLLADQGSRQSERKRKVRSEADSRGRESRKDTKRKTADNADTRG